AHAFVRVRRLYLARLPRPPHPPPVPYTTLFRSAEEVERAVAAHPQVRDVIVVGRPSEQWGSEPVAIVQLADENTVTDAELLATSGRHLAGYKVPKAILRRPEIVRSPTGKADYRWASEQVTVD